jgi:hypothetical protein
MFTSGTFYFFFFFFFFTAAIKEFAYKRFVCGTQDGYDDECVTMGTRRVYSVKVQ